MTSISSKESFLEVPLQITSTGDAIQLGKDEFIRHYIREQSQLIGQKPVIDQPIASSSNGSMSVKDLQKVNLEAAECLKSAKKQKQRNEERVKEGKRFETRQINQNAKTRYAKRLSMKAIENQSIQNGLFRRGRKSDHIMIGKIKVEFSNSPIKLRTGVDQVDQQQLVDVSLQSPKLRPNDSHVISVLPENPGKIGTELIQNLEKPERQVPREGGNVDIWINPFDMAVNDLHSSSLNQAEYANNEKAIEKERQYPEAQVNDLCEFGDGNHHYLQPTIAHDYDFSQRSYYLETKYDDQEYIEQTEDDIITNMFGGKSKSFDQHIKLLSANNERAQREIYHTNQGEYQSLKLQSNHCYNSPHLVMVDNDLKSLNANLDLWRSSKVMDQGDEMSEEDSEVDEVYYEEPIPNPKKPSLMFLPHRLH